MKEKTTLSTSHRLEANDFLLSLIDKLPYELELNKKLYDYSLIILKNFQKDDKFDGTFLPVSVLGTFYPPLMQSIKIYPFPDPLYPEKISPIAYLNNSDGTIHNLKAHCKENGQCGSFGEAYDEANESVYVFEFYPGNTWEMHSNIIYAFVFMEVKSSYEANCIFQSMLGGKLGRTTISMRQFLNSFLGNLVLSPV